LKKRLEIDDLEQIIEELVVDIDPQKSGWAGTPEDIMRYKEQMRMAQLAATEAHEENMELVAARDRLSENNEQMKGQLIKMSARSQDFERIIRHSEPFKRKTFIHESSIDKQLPE
jgi:hypothetical protein